VTVDLGASTLGGNYSLRGSKNGKEQEFKAHFNGLTRLFLTFDDASSAKAIAFKVEGQTVVTVEGVDVDEIRRVKAVKIFSGAQKEPQPINGLFEIKVSQDNPEGPIFVDGSFLLGAIQRAQGGIAGLSMSYVYLPGIKWIVQSDIEIFQKRYSPDSYVMEPGAQLRPVK